MNGRETDDYLYPIILCVGASGRAVVFGWVDADPVPGEPVTLYHARMVLYWSQDCDGLFGLAANGPKTSTRMTPAVERTSAVQWKEWLVVSPWAAEALDGWPARG